MSDHYDSPEPRTDICDLYVFARPDDPSHTILVMDVNSEAPKRASAFDPQASYEFKIDTNGDLFAELAFHMLFSAPENGPQTATLYQATGTAAEGTGGQGEVIIDAVPVCFDERVRVGEGNGFRLYAGMRSDPFFFDFDGYFNNFQWTGRNVNEHNNVFSIVLDVPNRVFGDSRQIAIWVRTLALIHGALHQVDQAGHPGTSPVFFQAEEEKVAFNGSHPSQQVERFQDMLVTFFCERFDFSPDEGREMALQWLPDMLPFEPGYLDGYPNGRGLNDDTIGLAALEWTRGKCAPNPLQGNANLLGDFPYLGAPHEVTEK